MVKKKNSETEDIKERQGTETTENKNNTINNQMNQQSHAEAYGEDLSEERPSESETDDGPVSDKKLYDDKQLLEKLAEMQDKYLRLSAEFDNYRKRTLKEKMEISKFAGEELLKEILPFMDDFERALKHLETTENCNGIKEGIDLIYYKLIEFLKHHGVKEIESLNSPFDVDLHDAVAKIPVDEDDKKGRVIEVMLKGYYLKDKVLRHSKVVIGE
jgi:molecular chaperone GrpE